MNTLTFGVSAETVARLGLCWLATNEPAGR
jgi:hypothetical protein